MYRRSLLKLLGAAAAALPWRPSLAEAQTAPLTQPAVATLRAVAPVVLPSELGAKGTDAVVDAFLVWLRGYKSGEDMGYGYGVTRKQVTRTLTAADYLQHLDGLERAAAPEGSSFAALPLEARRRIIAAALESAGVRELPSSPDGKHAVADFMSFYFSSPDANDLCYQAKIGRERCRTLAGSSSRPTPLGKA